MPLPTRPRVIGAILAAAPILLAAAPAGPAARSDGLPLGPGNLPESRHSRELAPGVTYTTIVRGTPAKDQFWTLTLGFFSDRRSAEQLVARLEAAGRPARIRRIDERAPDDPRQGGPLGFVVRSGRFGTQAEALAESAKLLEAGFPSSVQNTAEDGGATTGPWVVRVLRIDPRRFAGTVRPVLATGIVRGRATVTAVDAKVGSFAAVNGGYFVVEPTDGTPGDLAGISVVGGDLVSEAVRDRTDLVLPTPGGAGARITEVQTRLSARSSDGALREVDGLNRDPGLIRACGGVGGDRPTSRPLHDVTCTDPSELVVVRREFGRSAPAGDGVEAELDATGTVRQLRFRRGGQVPAAGALLQGTGDGGRWLRQHARPGMRVVVRQELRTEGSPLALTPGLGIVNGGPQLVQGGRTDIEAYEEGFVHPDDPGFYWAFGVRRNPRTLAGVTSGGELLLVTCEGRAPGFSVGLSFVEEARVMRALGARDAVNLDGGGSTAMVIGDRLVTRPSDTTGERPVGDAIVLRR